jgi:glycosyltransferase involved in cell wall biosynthesis
VGKVGAGRKGKAQDILKILHTVQLYHPRVGGSEEVVKQLSERLAARGHDITVATASEPRRESRVINGVKVAEFDLSGNDVRGIEGDGSSYQNFVREGQFDLVMNYACQIWSTDLVMPNLDEVDSAKVIVPCGYSGLHDPDYEGYFQKLPRYLEKYDKAVYLSEHYQDKHFADQHGLTNSIVIPNGADEREFIKTPVGFRKKYGIRTKYMLLSVCNHYNLKGHDFIIDAFNRLERKDVTLVIIGNPVIANYRKWRIECYKACRVAALKNRRIKVLTHVPRELVVSAYQEADLFVFGSLVECSPLVIFESMAAGLPFVSTDVGDVKERAEFGQLVSTRLEMAGAISAWLDDDEKRATIGQAAQEEWSKKYSWERITDRYEQLYQDLVSKRS